MDDETPPTQPDGALSPPRKPPSTAIATASPAPLGPRPGGAPFARPRTIRALVEQTLDAVDKVADSIGRSIGLR